MKKTLFARLATVFLFTFALASCQKEDSIAPAPAEETDAPSVNPAPTVAPIALRALPTQAQLKQVSWDALDYKTYTYNTEGKLIKYYSQYNYVQGTDIVQKFIYDFTYNEAGNLAELKDKNGSRYVYIYDKGQLRGAVLYYPNTKIGKQYRFTFNPAGQMVKYQTYSVVSDNILVPSQRVSLTYDGAGNLTNWKEENYDQEKEAFQAGTEIIFSEFDDKHFAPFSHGFGDVLLPFNFWVNNPGKKEIVNSGSPVEHYRYTYNSNGFPLSKISSYSYYKPLPELTATFSY